MTKPDNTESAVTITGRTVTINVESFAREAIQFHHGSLRNLRLFNTTVRVIPRSLSNDNIVARSFDDSEDEPEQQPQN